MKHLNKILENKKFKESLKIDLSKLNSLDITLENLKEIFNDLNLALEYYNKYKNLKNINGEASKFRMFLDMPDENKKIFIDYINNMDGNENEEYIKSFKEINNIYKKLNENNDYLNNIETLNDEDKELLSYIFKSNNFISFLNYIIKHDFFNTIK